MKYLNYNVSNLTLSKDPKDKTSLISGSINYFGIHFNFDVEFGSIPGVKSVEFFKNRRQETIDIVDGYCIIPSWVLKDKNPFEMRVISGTMIGTPWLTVKDIVESGMVGDEVPEDEAPEETQYVKTLKGETGVVLFRENNGVIEYSKDGSSWSEVRVDSKSGKNILCVGDSLMASITAINTNNYDETYGWNGGYSKLIKDAHPAANVYNHAVANGGLCTATAEALVSQGSVAENIFTQLKNKIADMDSVDCVVINGCGNDIYVTGMTGGSIADLIGSPNSTIPTTSTDDSTICGALEIMFAWLVKNYPTTKIVYISLPPIKQFYSIPTMYNAEIENTMVENISTVCTNYGVEFIDLTKTILRRDLYFNSGLFYESDVHLTDAGYEAISDLISNI